MQKLTSFLRLIANGMIVSIFLLIIVLVVKKDIPYELFLSEAIPFFQVNSENQLTFSDTKPEVKDVFNNQNDNQDFDKKEPRESSKEKVQETEIINDIEYDIYQKESATDYKDTSALRNFDYFKSKFYVADKKVEITPQDFDINKLSNVDTTIDNAGDLPKILIFHTHSTEMYRDSDENNIMDGVVGLGRRLSEILDNKYNIKTLHHTGRYDIVNNKPDKRGAYERMEPEIRKIIKANPSLQVAIDLHRDGVADSVHLVENINGKPTAKIMFVNGLCKILKNNILIPIDYLPNPYLNTNLALSFRMQQASYKLYPNLNRKIYVNAYRYSLHMLPKSLLVEIGAQTNTKQEAFNAMEPLADMLADVLLKKIT